MKKMLLSLAVCQTLFAAAQPCSTIYVDVMATGAANGTSWANAFPNLQDAITEAANCLDNGVEIWVAKGTYKPDIGETQVTGNRHASFYLLDNLTILGGFEGTETLSSQRDWQANETILSGNIGNPADSTDNSYTIVTAIANAETAILDGFTIRDAYAKEMGLPFQGPTRSGGGLHNTLGSPRIRHCIFRNNSVLQYGGGAFSEEGNPTFSDCIFLQNRALRGGGMRTIQGNPKLIRCVFRSNNGSWGGGLDIEDGAPVLENCLLEGNKAEFGGGVFVAAGTTNGAMFFNCLWSGNDAGYGGGIAHSAGTIHFYNCTLAGNRAFSLGGGIQSYGNFTFTNGILWDNLANDYGNQIWINYIGSGIQAHLYSSCFRNGVNDLTGETGIEADANCTNANPLFVAPLPIGITPAPGGDYRLQPNSSLLNSGDNAAIAAVSDDLAGNARIFGSIVDMGAYELQTGKLPCPPGNRLYVNSAAAAGGDGTSWATAFRYLQDALLKSAGCLNVSEIWVARGLYLPDHGEGLTVGDRNATFRLQNGISIYGGFAGHETSLSQRNWQFYVTTLSGDIGQADHPDDNSYNVLLGSATDYSALLDGVTVRDGYANTNLSVLIDYFQSNGGGMYNEGGSPTIQNCIFRNNFATEKGGAIINWRNSAPTLYNCTFTENTADEGGGIHNYLSNPFIDNCHFSANEGSGLSNNGSNPVINACTFVNNHAAFGGAIYNLFESAPEISNSIFSGNRGTFGGAVYSHTSSPSYTNCLFSGNEANRGGAINNLGAFTQTYTHCTFSGNEATSGGGAILNQGSINTVMTLNNCILWGNSGDGEGNQIESGNSGSISLFSSCYANGANDIEVDGSFNVDANCMTVNPLFIQPVLANTAPTIAGNYRLSPCSPLINEGDNNLIPAGTTTDLDQQARIVSGLVDMGAYEFRDTGNLQLPQIELAIVQPVCSDTPTGSAAVSVSGGSTPYSYLWSGGQTTSELDNLAPGDYTLTVTDNGGCKASVSFTITTPDPVESTIIDVEGTLCGSPEGQATVVATGGASPYGYVWDNGQTSATATGLSGGLHTVSVTDANGCLHTNTVTIVQSDGVEALISTAAPVSCAGNDGALEAQVSGGTGPFSYLWNTDATTAVLNDLPSGNYSVTVTDALGCTAIANATLEANTTFESQLTDLVHVSCNGQEDGSATVAPINGTAPFSYLWDNGQTTATAENLSPENHSVTLTDATGCTTTQTVLITEPALLTAAISNVEPIPCTGNQPAEAMVTVAGGIMPYTYLWSNGQTSALATGLGAGDHTVEISDANGCITTASVTILLPQPPEATITNVQDASACDGTNGSASVQVSGGQLPYHYLWSNGQTSATATALSVGAHQVTVTDAAGCTDVASVDIISPPLLEGEIADFENAACMGLNNGTATVSVSGGSLPYTYVWDNGQTSATATGLAPGPHIVTVTDAGGCIIQEQITITAAVVLLTTVSLEAVNNCFGDADASILITPANGTAPYTFHWNTGADTPGISNLAAGTYLATITDASGCTAIAGAIVTHPELLTLAAAPADGLCSNTGSATAQPGGGTSPYAYLWSDGQTTATAQNLAPGIYTVTVTDAKGCTANTSVIVNTPPPLELSIANIQSASCTDAADGSASAEVAGGVTPYLYLWSDGQTTATADGLLPGDYSVTVTDANNCTIALPFSIQAAIPALNPNTLLEGTALFALQNGAQYQWIDCATNLPVAGATGQLFQPEATGSYAVIITIGNCSVQSSCVNVTVTDVDELPLSTQPVLVFPNPNAGMFSMVLPEAALVTFFNAAGERLWQSRYAAGRHEMDRRQWPAGVYWLHVIRNKQAEAVKVVIE